MATADPRTRLARRVSYPLLASAGVVGVDVVLAFEQCGVPLGSDSSLLILVKVPLNRNLAPAPESPIAPEAEQAGALIGAQR